MNCRECGHAEYVHFMFAGCCGHGQCPCEGTDGALNCRRDRHGEDCWWSWPKPVDPADERLVCRILGLHLSGFGSRRIMRLTGFSRSFVRTTIRSEKATVI